MAAGLLEEACAPGAGDPLRLEVVRTLARDLAGELQALSVPADSEIGAVEGALRATDLANLATCAVPEPTPRRRLRPLGDVRGLLGGRVSPSGR